MKNLFFLIITFFSSIFSVIAAPILSDVQIGKSSNGGPKDLIQNRSWDLIGIFTFIESFLLKVVLPLVVVGVFLYIAWELLTAEGNEEKMKKAWKAVTFAAIGLLMIALAYAIVAMASRLSL